MHGDEAFQSIFPNVERTVFDERHTANISDSISQAELEHPSPYFINEIHEWLPGLLTSAQDLWHVLQLSELWHDGDERHLEAIRIGAHGCWEMPFYDDTKQPRRYRYPQPRAYSERAEKKVQWQGAAWMWTRLIGEIPDVRTPSGKRALWTDHRCSNRACVYPRHIALGTIQANNAFTARLNTMRTYNSWQSERWARASYAFPDGIRDLVADCDVTLLSERSAITSIEISRMELEASVLALSGRSTMPRAGFTTDPGHHVLFAALKRGVDFDEVQGCWVARFDLNQLAPHKQTITHPCGDERCVNPRHMDITEGHKKYYDLNTDAYMTLPNGNIVNLETGEILPSYWESWNLYWNWLKKYSDPLPEHEANEFTLDDTERLLSEVDFSHIWVHPLAGCWENERFYPRWGPNGNQQNGYGFHRATYGKLGRSTHRYLLYKYHNFIGKPVRVSLEKEADHCCNNRRCCNPLHLQFRDKKSHASKTQERIRMQRDDVAQKVARLAGLRKLKSWR
jgi:hypothetical protein